ncbi:hypothetical protein DL769_010506 [Monosporascus sp. CRB-8-3]|nr:hypothetical protein DL769_010506 [Monosporascus sp. CRB-8-3]
MTSARGDLPDQVLGETVVFPAGPALAEELCDEKRFRKFVRGPIIEIRYGAGDSLFAAFDHEENCGVAHRIIGPHLYHDVVAGMFDEMRDNMMELIAKWRSLGPDASRASAIGELNRLNLEATRHTLFGQRLGCLGGPNTT